MEKQITIAPGMQSGVERYAALANVESESVAWLRSLRRESLARFEEQGFPTTKNEEWKFTDIRPIADLDARVATSSTRSADDDSHIESHYVPNLNGHRLVFLNGNYAPELSHLGALPDGVVLSNLRAVIDSGDETVQHNLGRTASATQDTPFIQLNMALLQDGAFLHVPAGVVVEQPIEILFHSTSETDQPTTSSTRNLFVLGANSRVQIVEHYAGEGVYFTNTVTEVVAGANANVDHVKLQLESEEAFHISSLQVNQERDCKFASHNIDLGGRLVRNNGNAVMGGANIECTLNGLYVTGGDQHIDNHTAMDHAQPHCNSFEIYAGIMGGRSRGVFNGKIFVRRDAQKTDAKQSNRNLLLGGESMISTKPQLEIFADDVKCTHGCTIGQLDEDALFYLRSRGLPLESARNLLIYAFANDVINGIEEEPVRTFMEAKLSAKLAHIGVDESVVAA